MKRTVFAVLSIVCFATPVCAVDPSVFREMGIVPIFGQNLYLQIRDIELEASETDFAYLAELGTWYSLDFQSRGWDIDVWDGLDFAVADDSPLVIANDASASITKYFPGLLPVPISVSVDGRLESVVTDSTTNIMDYAFLSAGIGVGRLVDVTPVARIIATASKLGLDLTNEQAIDAARIAARSIEYWYRHRGRYDEEYYGAIAEALDMGDVGLAVRRAYLDTSTAVYRRTGWSAQIYASQSYFDTFSGDPRLGIVGVLEIPIGLDVQLSTDLRGNVWIDQFFGDVAADAILGVRVGIDHTANWSSSTRCWLGIGSDLNLFYSLSAYTTVRLIDRLYSSASIWYDGGSGFLGNVGWELYLGWDVF